jgi:hypothetical protein
VKVLAGVPICTTSVQLELSTDTRYAATACSLAASRSTT